jgi:hypothetical protein
VKLHHKRLIFRADRPQDYGGAILHGPRNSVLRWVRSNRRLGEFAGAHTFVVPDAAFAFGRTNEGNAGGLEQRIERPCFGTQNVV